MVVGGLGHSFPDSGGWTPAERGTCRGRSRLPGEGLLRKLAPGVHLRWQEPVGPSACGSGRVGSAPCPRGTSTGHQRSGLGLGHACGTARAAAQDPGVEYPESGWGHGRCRGPGVQGGQESVAPHVSCGLGGLGLDSGGGASVASHGDSWRWLFRRSLRGCQSQHQCRPHLWFCALHGDETTEETVLGSGSAGISSPGSCASHGS